MDQKERERGNFQIAEDKTTRKCKRQIPKGVFLGGQEAHKGRYSLESHISLALALFLYSRNAQKHTHTLIKAQIQPDTDTHETFHSTRPPSFVQMPTEHVHLPYTVEKTTDTATCLHTIEI